MRLETLKSTFSILLVCTCINAGAQFRQGAKNYGPNPFEGPWVLIHAQRIDGSRVIDRSGRVDYHEYSFTKNYVFRRDSITYAKTTTANNVTIIDATHATRASKDLEIISDTLLVITEKYDELSMDKKNKLVFLKKDRYLTYLKTTPYFILENDTTIVANGHIFPSYEFPVTGTTLTNYLLNKIGPTLGAATGYFMVDKQKFVTEVQLTENRDFNKWDALVDALKETSGIWDLPVEGYNYKVFFTVGSTEGGKNIDITFRSKDFDWFKQDHLGLSGKQITALTSLFDRGNKYIESKNFEKSIADFTTCIAIDPLFLDAYYNRAYAYLQLKKTKDACKDWKFLRDLDQVTGKQLFEQNCKK